MPSVAAVSEEVHGQTCEEEQEWEVSVEVCPVLRDEEEADDGEEPEEGDIETAHTESGEEKSVVVVLVVFVM